MALSGFPEWLPEGRLVELAVLDTARRVFERHGFASIETRSVEPVDQLLRKGEIDKEVYAIRRLHGDGDSDLALHFDLTVPLARYVVEHAGQLAFPFRRYQIQKVWRGERPQDGRFREFTQADIDIIGDGELGFAHEVEMALVMAEVFEALPIPRAVISVNNRKLAEGFYRGVGAADPAGILRTIDKIDKIGPDKVMALLQSEAGLDERGARLCVALADIRSEDLSFIDRVRSLGVRDDLLDEGIEELAAVVAAAHAANPGAVVANLRIARGLDYYTGTVYETELVGHESIGSVSSGGRYDRLASKGSRVFPGVGISLGVTRLVSVLLGRDLVRVTRSVPSAVLIAVNDEASRAMSQTVASQLRSRGVPCEVAPQADKFGKQIRYAERRGIPYVWFLTDEGQQVKDIRSGAQVAADPLTWAIPEDDRHPQVIPTSKETS